MAPSALLYAAVAASLLFSLYAVDAARKASSSQHPAAGAVRGAQPAAGDNCEAAAAAAAAAAASAAAATACPPSAPCPPPAAAAAPCPPPAAPCPPAAAPCPPAAAPCPPPAPCEAGAARAAAGAVPAALVPVLYDRYLELLKGFITNSLLPEVGRCGGGPGGCDPAHRLEYEDFRRVGGDDWPVYGLTMVGIVRMDNVRMAIETVVREGIAGDFVELGTWRGGVCMFAKAIFDALGESGSRQVALFDTYEPMAGYAAADVAGYLAAPLEKVKANFERLGLTQLHPDSITYHKGYFNDTLPGFVAQRGQRPIAVLRLDGNFYSSYEDCLYRLYEFVPVGGFVIFDDIRSIPDVQLAWNNFQEDQGFKETVTDMPAPDPHAQVRARVFA